MTACLLDAVAAKIAQECHTAATIVPSRSAMSSAAYPIWAGNLPQMTWAQKQGRWRISRYHVEVAFASWADSSWAIEAPEQPAPNKAYGHPHDMRDPFVQS